MRVISTTLLVSALLISINAYGKEKITVLSSIKPIAGITKAIGGDHITVETILESNHSEHIYQLKPQDRRLIETADLIFWIGPTLETYLKKPLKRKPNAFSMLKIPNLTVLPARQGQNWEDDKHQHHQHDTIDSHIWLDPNNALIMIPFITDKLIEKDPNHKKDYEQNAKKLSSQISAFDQKTKDEFAHLKPRGFFVFHDGYQYFEHHYKLKANGSISVGHDQGLKPKSIAKIITHIKEGKASCLFTEPGQEAPIIQKLAKENNIYLGQLDPMGSLIEDNEDHYLKMLDQMKHSFINCFSH